MSQVKPNMSNPVHFLAFGFGSGLAPKAPGTFGTLAAIPLWYLLATYASLPGYLLVTLLAAVVGIWLCGQTAKDLGVHDHGGIVWDEVVGLLVTMVALPVSWLAILLGFVAFRLFDIVKPWPISWLDRRVGGGLGIMIDDILAGVFAAISVHLIFYFL